MSHKQFLVVLAVLFASFSAAAQTSPNLLNGLPPQGSYDATNIDTVNLMNGNLTLHIPLPITIPQRGKLKIAYYLVVNSKIWQAAFLPTYQANQWGPTTVCTVVDNPSTGPCGQGPLFVSTASFGITRTYGQVFTVGQGTDNSVSEPRSFVTWDGAGHPLVGGDGTGAGTFVAGDTSGYRMTINGSDFNGLAYSGVIIDRDGTQYSGGFTQDRSTCSTSTSLGYPTQDGSTRTTTCSEHFKVTKVTDANGNVLATPLGIPDLAVPKTNGPTIASHQAVGAEANGCLSSFGTPFVSFISYPANNGQSNQIKLCFAIYPQLSTSFSPANIHQFQDSYGQRPFPGSFRQPVYLSNVFLPDGTQWGINYDSYGEITSVTTPTGAAISYTWAEGQFPITSSGDLTSVSRAVHTRTVSDRNGNNFLWTYQWGGLANDGTMSHTVTDSLGNDTVHIFKSIQAVPTVYPYNFKEISTLNYQGNGSSRALLRQSDTTWFISNSTYAAIPTDIKTTVFPIQKSSLIHTDYDPSSPVLGLVTSKKIYDWAPSGQSSPGALLREEDTMYQWQKDSNYLAANLIDLPASKVVISPVAASNTKSNCQVDAAMTLKSCTAETDYTYDEAAYLTNYEQTVGALPTGSHVAAPNSVRGNLTTISEWLNTGGSVTSHKNWYDTGEVYQEIDPLGHTTTYSYDLAYAGALPTQTCNPKGQCTSATYDLNTGLITSLTDANGSYPASGMSQGDPAHTTTYTYDFMGRMTSAISPPDPNGSQSQTSFNYLDPVTVQQIKSITASLTDSLTSHSDGLDHVVRTEHATSSGTAVTDTTYDGLGHVTTASNPYFSTSDSTYGITTNQYDALGRVTHITKQDGSISSVSYDVTTPTGVLGNCTAATDEAGKQRRTCLDALGHIVEVDEPNPGAQPVPAQGTLSVNGTLQSQSGVGAFNAAAGTASLTITGIQRSVSSGGGRYCAQYNNRGTCVDWETDPIVTTFDSGNVTITINGHPTSTPYGTGASDASTVASGLATAINNDAGAFVNASSSGAVLTLIARHAGANTNYSWSLSSASSNPGTFGTAGSFSSNPTSGALSGGTDGSGGTTVYDAGTVTLTIGAFTASAPYGQTTNSTAAQLAAALASSGGTGLNRAGSPVNAIASGATITLTYNTPGIAGNGVIVSASSQSTQTQWTFPAPSFTSSGTTLANGMNATDLNNSTLVTLYQYDALGNLVCVEQHGNVSGTGCNADPSNDATSPWRVRRFSYDSLSRLLTAKNPESGTLSYAYDADGNVRTKTSPAPNQSNSTAMQTISYCHDELHRLTGKGYGAQTCPLSSPVATYTYDSGPNAKGKLTQMTDQAGAATYSYGVLERLASETRTLLGANNVAIPKTLSYEYNLDGSVAKLHYPSGAVITTTPDSAGRMLSAVDTANGINYVTAATYGADGSLTGFVSGNSGNFAGITNSFSYNKRLQPLTIAASTPSQTVFSIGYDFHAGNGTAGSGADNGNVWGMTNYKDNTRSQTFTYDLLNRLNSAQNAGTACATTTANSKTEYWGNSYSYDPWGNLIGKAITKCGAENLSLTADAHNWIHAGGTDYQYDAAGNMTYDATAQMSYTYDQENRLTGANGYSYTYDGDGNRVKKSNGSTGTLYWYMTIGPVAETDLAGTLKSEYIIFGGERVARKDFPSNTVAYYFSDRLRSTSVITDASGNIKSDYDYYPWGGELQLANNDSNHYKFGGHERDAEDGLDYFGARYYSNALGRFTVPDWAEHPTTVPYAVFGNPQSLNLYAYTTNNPTTLGDPDGHFNDPFGVFSAGNTGYSNMNSVTLTLTYTTTTIHNSDGSSQSITRLTGVALAGTSQANQASERGSAESLGQCVPHCAVVSVYPKGAGGFGHTGIQVDNEDTRGFSTLDPKTPWYLRLFWAPKARVENDIAQHTDGKGNVASHYYIYIPISQKQSERMAAAIDSRRADAGRYNLLFRNCTGFVESVLHTGKVPGVPHSEIFVPNIFGPMLMYSNTWQQR
jgi:RHS repeat-associated protein